MRAFKTKILSVKGAILDKTKLCQYLEKLASEQIIKPFSEEETYPIESLKENFRFIYDTYQLLNEHVKLKINIDPAGEWLLDNFYILEEITKSIEKELTKKKYKNFVGIASGTYKGFARVFVLASEILAYTDGKIEEENLKTYLNAYQSKKLLTMEEIWNFPLFLNIAGIQNVKEICEKIYASQIQKYKAESIIERLVDKKEKTNQNFNKQLKYVKHEKENMSYQFIEYLSYKLKSYGKKGLPYLNILEEQVRRMGSSVSEVIKQVHFSLAVNKVSIGNLITSMKEISHMDFADISKQIGGVEEILKQDPAGIYEYMDYKTKSDYQNIIQKIAKKYNISELYIAETLLKIAQKAKNVENKFGNPSKMQEKKSHIGYYLIEDINMLYDALEVKERTKTKEQKAKIYMAINIVLPLYLSLIIFVLAYVNIKNGLLAFLIAIFAYLPLTDVVMQTIGYLLGKIVKPRQIPKMDYSKGIPKKATTFVVIPTILKNKQKVEELMKKLEVYYLANKSENIYFALLGDVTSGKSENEEHDKEVIDAGIQQINLLNRKYTSDGDFQKFHFLYRKRTWNPKEASFLGWERKRGLLIQFNEFLRKPEINEFKYNSLSDIKIPNIKYIITLDADTNLVLNTGLELVGAMEHVLNEPIVENGRVVTGHAILQPRVGVDLISSSSSIFSKIFALPGGTDFYTNAISDVYQDNFQEGIFTGKGIYNLEIFSDVITNQIPENTVLSHDLLEGSYLRCGLASDIMLIDGFPSKYNSYMTRLSRWIRGDWQIISWLFPKIKNRSGNYVRNPLNSLSKFKILDNLRRSIVPVSIFFLLIVGMVITNADIAFVVCFLGIFISLILTCIDKIVFRREMENRFVSASKNFIWQASGVTSSLYQTVLELCFLPYKVYISLKSIIKTLYRLIISNENLLEWMTSEEAEKQSQSTYSSYYMQMSSNIISSVVFFLLAVNGNGVQMAIGIILMLMWLAGPYIACYISKKIEREEPTSKLNEEERKHLLEIAKRTWEYFATYMNSNNNYLPPDNYEENRNKKIAQRTSPTNIGLGLLSIISAIDFKFIKYEEGLELLQKSMDTIEKLIKWNGHLYNWYDTQTLEPLNPRYISTVDSGNFIGYLYVVKQFLLENANEKTKQLINTVNRWIENADFSKLYDYKKKLFSIGFHLEENKLTDSYYDLLASEARQTSLIAIAKKDVPEKHWNYLSRTLTVFKKYKGLISWSGTAFEYLMSNMIIRSYPGSLLEESCKFMVLCQREYCRELGIPWGISEAAFAVKDFQGNYQYKAFGIPWLGLKRGLADDKVVSSYGSILAISEFPREVMENLKILENEKMLSKYGLYESIDYTPTRLKVGNEKEVVKSYMAHHQGLIMAALNNFFNANILVNRFMKNPEIEAVDILLQERMPKVAILTKEKKEKIEKIHFDDYEVYSQREYTKIDKILNKTNVISNDSYTVFMDERGRGYSKFKNILINKFKEDVGYSQGIFFYLKNIKTKRIWSTANLPFLNKPDKYKIIFSPDSNTIIRTDGNIESKEKITIVPEEPIEIRELRLKNCGITEEVLEISSLIEPVLSTMEQDYSHPVFNDLFLEYEWLQKEEIILVKRKKRAKNEKEIYLGVSLYCSEESIGEVEFELDKMDLVGKGNIYIPEKIAKSKPFSKNIRLVPESAIAFRQTIKIMPEQEIKISLLISVAENKQEAIDRLQEYRSSYKIERTFELSRAKNEAENRYLGLKESDTELYQKMLGYLLLQNPLKSLCVTDLPKEVYSQEQLWSLGISGDLPILVVKIKDPNDSYVIENVIKAKEFFLLRNCDVDIVIIDEEKFVYEQYVKDKIESIIIGRNLSYLIGQKNGIFIINSNELNEKQKNCLLFRSNMILDASKGMLKKQIEELEEVYLDTFHDIGVENPQPIAMSNKSQITLKTEELKYYNEYGGFNENGSEYTLKVNAENKLPTVWSHVIANEHFGTVVTDQLGGFTWSENSRLNRLTAWNNMPYLDIPSEILYIKERQTGKVWSNSNFVSKDEGDFKVTYGFGYANYTNLCNDFLCETQIFVPKQDKVKVSLVKLKNTRADKRSLKLIYYIKPVLGEEEQKTKGFVYLSKANRHCMKARNLSNSDFKGTVYLGTSELISSYTGDKKWFVGNGSIAHPEGIDKLKLNGENSLGKLGCIALEFELEIEPFESKEFCIYLGEDREEIIEKYNNIENCYQELATVKQYWFETLNKIQVKTPVESMNIMLNGWTIYQTIACRLWARSGYYQSGGAFGFRDQLQDTLGLKYIEPKFAKEQILRACEHQFLEGDVEHWWHEETQRGIRTRFSDDLLWLPYSVCEYCRTTENYELLEEKVKYLQGELLPQDVDERYDVYLQGNISESVYEHCIRAINKSIQFGKNGLPKIGSGDWNDGFSTVGNKGIGESVWLGFFLYDVLNKFIPICKMKQDLEKANYYEQIKQQLKNALNTKGWDGRWFRRAFTDSGDILGSVENEECKIDSISQSWAILSDVGENDKKYIAIEALENHLVDTENGLIRLLTPPFENSKLEPGYIKAYMPGVRENGGQYTQECCC